MLNSFLFSWLNQIQYRIFKWTTLTFSAGLEIAKWEPGQEGEPRSIFNVTNNAVGTTIEDSIYMQLIPRTASQQSK